MQHESAFGMNRTTAKHWLSRESLVGGVERQLLQNVSKAHIERSINDKPQGPHIAMFTNVRDGLVKVRIHHRWHRDQQMPSHMGAISHGSSIVVIGSRHKSPSAISLRFASHRYVGTN